MDRDLVERARSGDQEAFAHLVHQVSDTLFGVARRILRDPDLAEDALQNALVTIWRKLPLLGEADRFEGWAYRILVHACYAQAPRNRRWDARWGSRPGRTLRLSAGRSPSCTLPGPVRARAFVAGRRRGRRTCTSASS
jgi:RNA polymerase sigma-70 factor (ECF subfamily)